MISEEPDAFYDRPTLSKDFLARGTDPTAIALRPANFYRDHNIALRLATRVTRITPNEHTCTLADGSTLPFDRLILATGASPIRLTIPGAQQPNVHLLRSLGDARALQAAAPRGARAVVVGASFIALEAAAALATRGLEVHVVGPDALPLERVLGRDLGAFVQRMHESHGVRFHLQNGCTAIEETSVVLQDGTRLTADVVLMGVGVKPNLELAQQAGLRVENGVVCTPYLRTSHPDIYAAGDIVSFNNPVSGDRARIEHWSTAQKQGQVAARNILGRHERYTTVPFFWTRHYDTSIAYVGHGQGRSHRAIWEYQQR